MIDEALVRVRLPEEIAADLVAAGVARSGDPDQFRAGADVAEIAVVGINTVTTVITLMQGPDTWTTFFGALRRWRQADLPPGGPSRTRIDVTAGSDSLSVHFDSEVDAKRAARLVEQFLAAPSTRP